MKCVTVPVLVQRCRAGPPLTSIVSSRSGGAPEVILSPFACLDRGRLAGKSSKIFPVKLNCIVDVTEGHELAAV